MATCPAIYDVFFSYQWQDRAEAEQIAHAVQERGLRVFLDRWYLTPGGRSGLDLTSEILHLLRANSSLDLAGCGVRRDKPAWSCE